MGGCALNASNVCLDAKIVDQDSDVGRRKNTDKYLPSSGRNSFVSSSMGVSKQLTVSHKSNFDHSGPKNITKGRKPPDIIKQSDQECSESKITTEASQSTADISQSYLDHSKSKIPSISSSMESIETAEIWCFNPHENVRGDGLKEIVTDRTALNAGVLDAFFDLGANPNIKTHGDRTGLMVAVMANNYNLTKTLVEKGVDINYMNMLGETALGFAVGLKDKKILNYLRKAAVEL